MYGQRGVVVGEHHEVGGVCRSHQHATTLGVHHHLVRDVATRPTGHRLLDDERRFPSDRRETIRLSRDRVELRDPLTREELGHWAGQYRSARSRERAGPSIATMQTPTRRTAPVPTSLTEVGARAEARVIELLEGEIARWRLVDADLAEPIESLRELVLAGGKRLRPAFCHWAYVGAGGSPGDALVVDAGAALELLHTFALVHDDVMDGSSRRRGLPAVHERFIARHGDSSWRGEGRRFGEGAAILVGDFAFVYADQLFGDAPPVARRVFDELRIELCVGQYLDLVGTASASSDPAEASRIARYKSGKYTVERPLHLGAALAGRLDDLTDALSAVGLPLGEAFQLRDDLLGVFGDESVTGKPVGDDLREGKLTPLVAAAAGRADSSGARLLQLLGRHDLTDADILQLQQFLVECGARDEIEVSIERLVDQSLGALGSAPISDEARVALEELAMFVAWRDR